MSTDYLTPSALHARDTSRLGVGHPPRSGRWHGVRMRHLIGHPLCAACGGSAHVEVHHIQPFHLVPDLELCPENLITLCEAPGRDCHLIIGHHHDWHSSNPNVVAEAKHHYDLLCAGLKLF